MTEENRVKADAIERDIVRTQNDMSHTVDRLKERLTPQSLMHSAKDKSVDRIVGLAKRHRFAVALLAGGAAWWATGKESRSSRDAEDRQFAPDPQHRAYVDHMILVEMRANETPMEYQRRRDIARANYFMIEREYEEDDTSFRSRLDEATEGLRARTASFGDQARAKGQDAKARLSDAGSRAGEQAQAAADKAGQLYRDNSLIGGLAALAAGAAVGSAIPVSRIEQEKLGDIGETARGKVGEQKDKLVHQAEKTLESAEQKI